MAVIKEDNGDAGTDTGTQYTASLGDVFQGTLDTAGDRDWIRLELTSGTVYAISPDGLGQWLWYQVFDSQGNQVQRPPNPFPVISVPPPGSKFIFEPPVSGTYYIQVYAFRPDENDGNPINYEVSVDENTIPVGTYDDLADYLTDGYWGGNRRAYDVSTGGELTADITGLTEKGQLLARWALEAWSNVTGIEFEFVDDGNAHITFDDNRPGGYAASSVIDGVIASSHVNIDVRWITNNPALGSYGAFLHEIGHALGLGHPGPYPSNNPTAYGLSNIYLIDSDQATLMSYFTQQENTYVYANNTLNITPMIADIIAIQNLYGVPNEINAGDTIYGYHSNVDGFLEQFFAEWTGEDNPFFNITLARNSRIDFVDLDNDGDPDLVVSSGPFRYFENIGTVASPDFMERTGTDNPISNISGYSSLEFADLNGDGDADIIVGGRGLRYFENTGTAANPEFMLRTGAINPLDAIEYGEGSIPLLGDLDSDSDIDLIVGYEDGTFEYFENTGTPDSPEFTQRTGFDNPFDGIAVGYGSFPAIVDIDGDNDFDLVVQVPDGGKQYSYFENTGTISSPIFTDRTGTDNPFEKIFNSLYGDPSFVDIDGDSDLDYVIKSSIGDIIHIENIGTSTDADFANRILSSNFVSLTLYDNDGIDTLDLRIDITDQQIDLRPEGISDVYGLIGNLIIARDTLIENFIAGYGNDVVIGNDAANHLEGRDGDDDLQGSIGNDVLEGGAGADRLDGGAGLDTSSYQGSDAGVTVRLLSGTGSGGHAEGDTLSGIENLIGSDYADIFGGNNNANRLSGLGGDDGLWGSGGDDVLEGGAGADRLNGGIGNDTATYESSDAGVLVRLHSLVARGGHAERDTFTGTLTVDDTEVPDIEHLTGSSHDDILAGDLRDNTLKGRAGNDTLYGGPGGGDDRMYGGDGDDRIFGGTGNDMISGDAGDDTLSGGPDDDTFVFAPGDGEDIIRDFGNGSDRIDLSAFADIDSFNDLSMEQQGDNVVIDLSGQSGGSIVLSDFDIANLDASDFLF